MAQILKFLTSLRTSPRRAVLIEVGFIVVGAALLGLTVFGWGR
ncbi:hypothetical protein [Phenylobacterium sp.]|nr:hypothetical protein [Phenylobacterium sp.]MDP3854647.1 hypothetical protein [Phenylobacterium sp.]